ncbi:MAG: glycosyltransferase family 2 protein [Bacteroidia bacterium]|nr:glycosyltransferase family 2 protein [Bacteroidia bacterium]
MSEAILKTKVAYIVVSWNNKDLLEECIDSIDSQVTDADKVTYLVDNNSQDDTIQYVTAAYPDVRIMAQHENHGFAKGNNIGIREALKDEQVEYIVLLNTDARLDTNWTQVLLDTARTKRNIATIQSVTLDYYDHQVIDSTHIYISRIGQGTQGAWRVPIASDTDIPSHKVFGCNAAAVIITRKFIEAQPFDDFFDETMFMYLEDVDVATRATVMGWDNYVVPNTRAYHMGSVSSKKKDPSFSLYMTFRNNTGLLVKNLPLGILFRLLVKIPKADLAAIKHLRRTGRKTAIPAVIQGRLKSLQYIPLFLRKRKKLKPLRVVDEDYLWKLMNRGY